jgi:hypothetical protein
VIRDFVRRLEASHSYGLGPRPDPGLADLELSASTCGAARFALVALQALTLLLALVAVIVSNLRRPRNR